jgi:hypothetical protein
VTGEDVQKSDQSLTATTDQSLTATTATTTFETFEANEPTNYFGQSVNL